MTLRSCCGIACRPLVGPVAAAILALGCSANGDVRTLAVPPAQGFSPVSAALGVRCGSLDCHGRVEQNMRLYSELGLRLDADDVPDGDETTPDEHTENYASVVALEPELMAKVWAEAGAGHARLSLIRKGRGDEAHTGGTVFAAGDAMDECIKSWLSTVGETAACEAAAEPTPSPFEPDEPPAR
jgi:hypothetical protein